MRFEDILKYLGEFGRYQKIQYALICLVAMPCAYISLGNSFLSASSDHYCRVYDNQTYDANSPVKNFTIPYSVNDNGEIEWSQCKQYNVTGLSYTPEDLGKREDQLSCDQGWVYDRSTYESTVVQEFDLVCDKDWLKQLSKSIILVGKLVGSLIFGQLSDRFGRKPVFIAAIAWTILVSAGTAFSPTYYVFAIGQFCMGIGAMGIFLVGFVIGVELVGPTWRTFAGIFIEIFYAIGYISLAVVAWAYHTKWRYLEMTIAIVLVPYLSYIWFVPESIRWLVQQGKYDKAEKLLKKAAKTNKVTLPDNLFDEEKHQLEKEIELDNTKKATFFDLFRTPNLRIRTLNIFFNWFANCLVYYGLSFNTDNLGENDYINFFISGAVEIPAYISCLIFMKYFGRRILVCVYMLVGGLGLFATLLVPDDESLEWLVVTLAMLGKFCIAASYAIIYVYAAELFPTPVRNVGMGGSSMSARVGGILSPYIMLLSDYVWGPLPYVLFGSLSILAGLLVLFLPETRNKALPETIEEGENFGTRRSKSNQDIDTKEVELKGVGTVNGGYE
ncbi:organic cation transporter protein-like [Glandiceps talaboti]